MLSYALLFLLDSTGPTRGMVNEGLWLWLLGIVSALLLGAVALLMKSILREIHDSRETLERHAEAFAEYVQLTERRVTALEKDAERHRDEIKRLDRRVEEIFSRMRPM